MRVWVAIAFGLSQWAFVVLAGPALVAQEGARGALILCALSASAVAVLALTALGVVREPASHALDEPVWWPEFERDFRAWAQAHRD